MTFLEKLKQEHPDAVNPQCLGGVFGCPYDYGYERRDSRPCDRFKHATCEECWNREIPETDRYDGPEYDRPENIAATARRHGLRFDLDLMQEECGELVQAVSKNRRYPGDETLDHIIEEMADVSIVTDELCVLIPDCQERMRLWREAKVKRTLERCGALPAAAEEKQEARDVP